MLSHISQTVAIAGTPLTGLIVNRRPFLLLFFQCLCYFYIS